MAQKTKMNCNLPTGIEIHGKKIRIYFSIKGMRHRESLTLSPSIQNIKFAERMRNAILHEINIGTFDYSKYFPNSKHAFGKPNTEKIAKLVDDFLDYKSHGVRRSTLQRYTWVLKGFQKLYGGSRDNETLSPRTIIEYQNKLVISRGGKTINRDITTVKAFLKWLYELEYIEKDLSRLLKKVKENDSNINPFSIEEVESAVRHCNILQHKNIVLLTVYTGLRTGELAALAWEDVDWENRRLLVRRSTYNDRGLKTTKTDKERYVDLMPPALDALRAQLILTDSYPAKEYDVELPDKTYRIDKLHFVFNPKVVREQKSSSYDYYGIRGLGRIWLSMCDKAEIKYRNQYQLRHTYASWMITHANVNISYLAQQMGHSDIMMIARVYGKWLTESNKKESDRVWRELRKLHHGESGQKT